MTQNVSKGRKNKLKNNILLENRKSIQKISSDEKLLKNVTHQILNLGK